MKLKITTALILGCIAFFATAQSHLPVFPSLFGQELLDSLVSAYKPLVLMPQAQGRDTLFGKIDNPDDSLTCVYTGFTIWLDPAQDPTMAAFMGGNSNAINTEHTFPQSLGASGLAEGDLHHLYPTRADANAARANSPFAEIPDNETEEWYYLNQKLNSKPATSIDLYSERKGSLFEPREDHKGNVARSMFYFYTMYKEQADMANATYFETQRQTLCAWHFLDPVDEREWNRTFKIAQYQDGKPNPYILDCTLPERTFCGEFAPKCVVAADEKEQTQGFALLQNMPNPVHESTAFSWRTDRPCHVRLEIFNALGEKTETLIDEWQTEGRHEFFWQKNPQWPAGLAFYRLVLVEKDRVSAASGKMVILP